MLTGQQILECQDIPRKTVHVPEWGGDVIVRGLTGIERDSLEMDLFGEDSKTNQRLVRASYAAHCIVDENGRRLFSDEEIERLGRKSARALDRIFDVARKLSGLTKADMEELEKNSGDGRGEKD